MKHLLKSLAIVLVALLSFVSCQNKADLEFEYLPLNENEVSNTFTRCAQNNSESYWEPFESINWAELNSLKDRFQYFNLSNSKVHEMTTEALLQLVVKYPLNYLILAYDDPFDAIKLVYDNCNIHKELVKRDEAASLLSNYFMNHHCTAKSTISTNDYNFVDELFMEYFIYICTGGDHSAIVLNSNQVISKWGSWALMQHDISDCPYPTYNLQYYKFQPGDYCRRTPFPNISGNSLFVINTQQTFSVPKRFPGLTTNWTVENIANPANTSSFSTMIISSGLMLVCYEVGAYRVRANFNYRGQDVSFSDMIVVARPY